MNRVVAIDGGAGAGKSTLARGLARRLGLPYVNTGEMYRALAAAAIRDGVDAGDAARLAELARALRFKLVGAAPPELEVEGWSRNELHSADVESTVSAVARHPAVRDVLRDAQRALAARGAVMEGRDIGTVVAPEAPVKIFVTADAEARARRRAAERSADAGRVGEAIARRDAHDARTNPIAPAPDARVVDTTDLDIEAALDAAVRIVVERAPELAR